MLTETGNRIQYRRGLGNGDWVEGLDGWLPLAIDPLNIARILLQVGPPKELEGMASNRDLSKRRRCKVQGQLWR